MPTVKALNQTLLVRRPNPLYDNLSAVEKWRDPNLSNAERKAPLHIFCTIDNDTIYPDLIEFFLDINAEMKQTVQLDAQDKLAGSPLQLAVANLLSAEVKVLLNRGADPSNFIFPHDEDFGARFNSENDFFIINKLKLASRALLVVESLENGGYELDRSDALTIMKFFAKNGLLEKSTNLDKCWYDDEEFVNLAKKKKIRPSLSLYNLIQLSPNETAKQLTYADYLKFARNVDDFDLLPNRYQEVCALHLCEKVSRGFFRDWVLDPFSELIRNRLPIDCCDVIIEKAKNDDLWSLFLACVG